MPTPNKNYRENPKRAVYITGKIDQDLVDRITPTINEFRLESTDPITAYVDSPGGSIALADTIRNHLTAPNPDGKRCRLITAVTSRAASAAADFVSLGDYAIGYPHAEFLYHGTRQSMDAYLTTEIATWMARSLQQTNETCAMALARHAFRRFVLRLSQLSDQFAEYANGARLSVLTEALQKELSSQNAKLLREALKRQDTIGDLTKSVIAHLDRFKDGGSHLPGAKFEAETLRAIVNYRIKSHRDGSWRLSESGLEEITEDFSLFNDFFGPQRKEIDKYFDIYGDFLLSDEQKKEEATLEGTAEEKSKWLQDKTSPKLRRIWYLLISVCRLLQASDYTLSSREAYWLGLVDEVAGSGLPSVRTFKENAPAEESP